MEIIDIDLICDTLILGLEVIDQWCVDFSDRGVMFTQKQGEIAFEFVDNMHSEKFERVCVSMKIDGADVDVNFPVKGHEDLVAAAQPIILMAYLGKSPQQVRLKFFKKLQDAFA